MSGRRTWTQEQRYSIEPLVVNRGPWVIDRSPEEPQIRRASFSGTTNPRRRTLFRIPNPFSRHTHDRVLFTERTIRRRHRQGDNEASLTRTDSQRGTPPAPPVIIRQTRSQSTPPVFKNDMSPKPGQREFVPLPPKLPTEEEKRRSREREDRRDSRQSRQPQVEPIMIDVEPNSGRRSPRPYGHRVQRSDPFDVQEQILEPSSPRPHQTTNNFEFIQPNEPIRSRQRDSDVFNHKEYIKMKALAEHNFKVAEKASQRYSTAEVRLQNLQSQLANTTKSLDDMKLLHSKANEREEDLRRLLERTIRELDECRREHRISTRERDLSDNQAKIAQDRLNIERQRQVQERDRDQSQRNGRQRSQERPPARSRSRDREDSGTGSNGRRRRHRIIRLHQDPRDSTTQIDSDGRTPRSVNSRDPPTTTTDPGLDVIARARRDAAARKEEERLDKSKSTVRQ